MRMHWIDLKYQISRSPNHCRSMLSTYFHRCLSGYPPNIDRPAALVHKFDQHQPICQLVHHKGTAVIAEISQVKYRVWQFSCKFEMFILNKWFLKEISDTPTHLFISSCIPDSKAFLNHSHRAATMTLWALKVCDWFLTGVPQTAAALSFCSNASSGLKSKVMFSFWQSVGETTTSNSMSASCPECSSFKAFFERLLLIADGGSHRLCTRLSCRGFQIRSIENKINFSNLLPWCYCNSDICWDTAEGPHIHYYLHFGLQVGLTLAGHEWIVLFVPD